ncbi:UvrD-helicase domain-containing protein [Nostoc sp. 'Peltigera membranacea cyanobiont' N6]|uniref:UvrD-helicase domain-containing protein n=1 Tax=Nostoc sp. 'Peltigera membranacea cyanobiont' N6 TaxID=1261031 RepID=UPI000CF342CD|nr:UvrD-helicase domain-containing protein [Nostoc sp. 'Peltigera membranacea cyanobiont' N6]
MGYKYTKRKQPPELAAKICDTLELSCLFLVGQPQHKLNKLYRKELGLNDPLEDARESYAIYKKICESHSSLPLIVRYWAWELLPDGYPCNLIPRLSYVEEITWEKLQKRQPMLDIPGLQSYLNGLPRHNIKNLGAIVFLNWLYQFNESEVRRPNWLECKFPSFGEAEKNAFPLPLDEVKLSKELKQFFGFETFKTHQLEIVQALLKGKTVPLGILPTGGGKSIIFQLPALILSKYYRGLSIIVSPLQALMADQVQNLKEKLKNQQLSEYAERVELLTGAQCLEEQRRIIEALWNGQVDILYLSPERLRQPTIQRILKHRLPHLWVLDEAHTLSQWGYDFRPDFLRIAESLQKFYKNGQNTSIRWGFVTATATLKVIEDLEEAVKKLDGLCSGSLERLPLDGKSFQWRDEIKTHIEIVEIPKSLDDIPDSERLEKTKEYLKKQQKEYIEKYPNLGLGVAIVYVPTRRMAEKYAEHLNQADFKTTYFHSRISNKQQVLEDFKAGKIEVVVATNAFGMGIDREGIHTVIHVAPPATPEAYVQEIGRLARNQGERGSAYLFWHQDDFNWIFEQQGRSQISFQALKSCWDLIRPRLKTQDAWISTLDLAKPLSLEEPEDLEILETQARVAIFYLEKAGLIREGESCPCYLNIYLKRELNLEEIGKLNSDANKLALFLFDIGFRRTQSSIKLDVREVSLVTGILPPSVIKTVRKLVNLDLVNWEYKIAFKFEKQSNKKLEQFKLSTEAFLNWLQSESPEIDEEKSILLHVEALEDKLGKKAHIAYSLKILTQLKLATYTKESRDTTRLFLKTKKTLTQWLESANKIWEKQWQEIDYVENILDKLFKDKNWKREDSQLLDLAELETRIDILEYPKLDLLKVLAFMQRLGVVVLGRGDLGNLMLYHLLPGKDRKNWYEGVYPPLDEHYTQRRKRIDIMRQVLEAGMQDKEEPIKLIQILEDYFTLSLDEFSQRCGEIHGNPPIVETILENLNPTQKRIVTDDQSRALLVLAGPGSGKTHTIVSRVAYLVSARGVPPERILVLAYNRTAAAEVRKRLHQLLGKRGTLVDALTFHALAAKLTGLRSKGEGGFKWLLEQAIIHLQENHPGYQYILVDEYQDIDKLQYDIITRLAGFNHQDEDESQKSFLMAVGDDDQILYEWNGASVKFIRDFWKDYDVLKKDVIPLVQNYRSRPTIVEFANSFIEKAIAPINRLKGVNERIQAVNTQQPGKVFWGEYRHLYDAAEWITEKIAEILTRPGEIQKEKIAVLAHRWEDLRFLQHVLRDSWGNDQDIAYQLYNTQDNLRPIKSCVGQAVLNRLREKPNLHVSNPQAHLEELRQELGYSDRDAAWSSLLQALSGCLQMTQEDMAYLLEEARPVRPGQVILSTFHSAKGSEFSHVFVLEDGFVHKSKLESRARELYVGFTRAKEELYILFSKNKDSTHPILLDIFNSMNSHQHIQNVQIAQVNLPPSIRYQWFLDPRDLYLSQPNVTNQCGRERIKAYAREWGQLYLMPQNNGYTPYEVCWKDLKDNNVVAVLSRRGKEQLQKHLNVNKHLVVSGHTIFRVERDDKFFPNAGEQGHEDHHYVVLPYFEVEEAL